MSKMWCAILLVVIAVVALTEQPARADFYKYTDNSGAVCMTNDRNAVPKEYRSTMKVVREDSPAKQEAAPLPDMGRKSRSVPVPEPAAAPEPSPDSTSASQSRWRLPARLSPSTPLAYLGACVVIFFIVRKVVQQVSSAHLSRLIYLCFFLGIFVFGYKCYAEHIVDNYFTVKARILQMYEKANKREVPEPQQLAPQVVREE